MTSLSTLSPADLATPPTRSTRRGLALAVLALAQFLVVLDASIVNIALPTIGTGLGLAHSLLTWVITAYVLPFGGLLLFGGRLADRFGHRRVFLAGVAGFALASLAAGLAVNGPMLLAARAVQGASAAMLAPAALALLMQLFPAPAERAKALGVWGAVAGLGSAAGVLLGGLLTARFGWSSIFLINLPIAAIVLAAIPALISKDRPGVAARLDLAGAATVTLGVASIVAGLSLSLEAGLLAPMVLGLFAAGAALLALFTVIEVRTRDALLPFAIFANRSVSFGNLIMLLVGGITVGLFFVLSLQMQDVLGFDAWTTGLTQLPLALAIIVAAGMVPAVIGRIGTQATLAASLVLLAGGLVWLAQAPVEATFLADLLGPTVVIGLALGGAFIAGTDLAVHGVSEADSGLAGGLVNTSQQIGGALGLALIFALALGRSAALKATGLDAVAALNGGYARGYAAAAILALLAAAIAAVLARLTKTA